MKVNRPLVKKALAGLFVLFITLPAIQYFSWNYWKVNYTFDTARAIKKAPPAVNLTLSAAGKKFFKKSFVPRFKNGTVIVRPLDITRFLFDKTSPGAAPPITVNGREYKQFLHFQFKRFDTLLAGGHSFYCIKPKIPIPSFNKLRARFPYITDALPKLLLIRRNFKRKRLGAVPGVVAKLRYGKSRSSTILPVHLKKDQWYEILFASQAYKRPPVRVSLAAQSGGSGNLFNHSLDTRDQKKPLVVSILFRPHQDIQSPEVRFLFRETEKKKPGRLLIQNITVIHYPTAPDLHFLSLNPRRSHITNLKRVKRLNRELVKILFFPLPETGKDSKGSRGKAKK